jgi:chromosome segregation ATPase
MLPFKKQLAEATAQIETLNSDIADAKEANTNLETQLATAQEAIDANEGLQESLETAQAELATANAALAENADDVAEANQITETVKKVFGIEEVSTEALEAAKGKQVNSDIVDAGHDAIETDANADDPDAVPLNADEFNKQFKSISDASERAAFWKKHKSALG